jgi:predicted AlkP superfamily phosphohydrolase/phosphomutase
VEKRKEAALHLLQSEPWDFYMMVFTAPDRFQHFHWAAMDANHPLHSQSDPRFRSAIPDLYRQLDCAVGQLLEAAGPNTNAIVLSDHGFTGWGKYLYLNDWLVQQGFLYLRHPRHNRWRRTRRRMKRIQLLRQIKALATRLSPDLVDRLAGPRETAREDLLHWEMIDWSRTKAYVDADRGLRINLKGREANGTVSPGVEYDTLRDQLITSLSELVDPETGYRAVHQVYKREELYEGPYFENTPDLVVEPVRDREDYQGNYAEHGLNPAGTGQIFVPSSRLTGNHTRDGIFIATGPAFRQGIEMDMADITDIAPTALYLLGAPLPTDLDGSVLWSALTEEYQTEHPIRMEKLETGRTSTMPHDGEVFSDAETDELTERLRGLGYLG